jgi:hypothetical protein
MKLSGNRLTMVVVAVGFRRGDWATVLVGRQDNLDLQLPRADQPRQGLEPVLDVVALGQDEARDKSLLNLLGERGVSLADGLHVVFGKIGATQ